MKIVLRNSSTNIGDNRDFAFKIAGLEVEAIYYDTYVGISTRELRGESKVGIAWKIVHTTTTIHVYTELQSSDDMLL